MAEYNEEFEALWKVFGTLQKSGLGSRGSKWKAYEQFKKLPDEYNYKQWAQLIARDLLEKGQQKLQLKNRREFFESFPHAERWIKYRRWEDEDEDGIQSQALALTDASTEEKIAERKRELMSRDWAEKFMGGHNG